MYFTDTPKMRKFIHSTDRKIESDKENKDGREYYEDKNQKFYNNTLHVFEQSGNR